MAERFARIAVACLAALFGSMSCQAVQSGGGISTAAAVQSFSVSSFSSTYPFAGAIAGEVSIGADSIRVRVDSGVVQNRMPVVGNGATVLDTLEVRAGVGTGESPAGWRVEILGPPILITDVLMPGQRVVLRPFRLAVARLPSMSMEHNWLVFELRANHHGINGRPPGPVTAYICSDRNLVGPPSASRERAELLRVSYNRAC